MAQTTTTTTSTTTTTTSTQQNQQLVVGKSTTSQSLGNYVTDVSFQPYIAQQIISFTAYNMRPNCRMHVFFDSVNVDAYCAPGIINPDTGWDSSTNLPIINTAVFGTPIYSDNNGFVCGRFSIPAGTFKNGDRVLEICDVADISRGNNAITTSAFATFTASNIAVTKQGITLTSINPSVSVANVTNTIVSSNTVTEVSSVTIPDNSVVVHLNYGYDPIAQAFRFSTPNSEVGGYITSIDLFFQQASLTNPNNGVTVYICETSNGYPDTSKIIPFSTTHISGTSINVSNTASVATNIKFESPVFLHSDTFYAFVVIPDNSDPDIHVWFANLGDLDVKTGHQVFSIPNVGTAFQGATTSAWTALQTEYIKFNIYRANFTSNYGTLTFHNVDRDRMQISNIAFTNTTASIAQGDYFFAANSGTNTVIATANGIVYSYNRDLQIVDVDNSSGNFGGITYVQIHRFADPRSIVPSPTTFVASATLVNVIDTKVNTIVPQYASIAPSGTQLRWTASATNNTYTKDTVAFNVNIDSGLELYDYERIIASKTNEVASMSGNKSLDVNVQLVSDSSYLSPLIDTVRSNVLAVSNKVDSLSADIYDEMFNYGTALTKYVSQPVVLASGQNAEDIQVIVDAYKPFNSYIKVYAKFVNSEDPESLINKTWAPLISTDDNTYSSYSNPHDYKTLTYKLPYGYGAFACNGTITTTSSCTTITGVGTNFTTQLAVGRYINVMGDYAKKIVAIANDTSLSIDSSFNSTWSANNYYLVPPPTTPWLSTNTQIQIAGTVSANVNSNIITGSGTKFKSVFTPGSIIMTNGDQQVVVAVANDTSLTVQTAWTSDVAAGNNAYIVNLPGINYLNKQNNLYTSYNQFQVKVVLLSDDSARVPIMKDIRALALQS